MVKLRAGTLVETLVSMTIILFCSTLAVMIYTRVLSSQNGVQRLRAFYIACEVIDKSCSKKDFLDASLGIQGMKIEKACKPYKGDNDLIDMRVTVKAENGMLLWEQKQLVINE